MFIWNCDSLTCSISPVLSHCCCCCFLFFCATVSTSTRRQSLGLACPSRDSQRDVLMDEKGTRLTSTAYGVIQAQPVGILVRPILCYSLPRALGYLRQVAVTTDSDMLGRLRTRLALPQLRAVMTISSAHSHPRRELCITLVVSSLTTHHVLFTTATADFTGTVGSSHWRQDSRSVNCLSPVRR